MDTTISPDDTGTDQPDDETLANAEFPVSLETLSVGGTNPAVGDDVEVKVGGKVTRIVNDLAYLKPETINGEPIAKPPVSPNPAVDERDRLMKMSDSAGDIGGTGY